MGFQLILGGTTKWIPNAFTTISIVTLYSYLPDCKSQAPPLISETK